MEAPYSTPKSRPKPSAPPAKHAVLPDGEIIEEQIADDEIIMNSNDFRDSDEEIFEEDGQSSSSKLPDRYLKPFGLDPYEVGKQALECPVESKSTFQNNLFKAAIPNLTFNYDSVDFIIKNASTEEARLNATAIRGLMEIMEVQNQKLTAKKNDERITQIMATLDPASFLQQSHMLIAGIDDNAVIDVNNILAEMSPQSGSLKTIIQNTANHWIRQVIPAEQVVSFSTSEKPKEPQTTLPSRFLNAPVRLLNNSLVFPGGQDPSIQLEVAVYFKLHVTNMLNHARSAARSARRK
ncbi:hypothetical protein GCK72_010947 [Caenorhabditis remanei]|uniref:Uncharacterized protein n=1 Tax=Caenorhabditis remanei TaxID=31234 RepID=A0A6A5H6G6_CAERE|nr:hypothetical protein GCK72_010947 [Caenorhabditis remanei]KAF1762685.1 hypothetical protein GCK72_010947 [Caenorhabditis remanei]